MSPQSQDAKGTEETSNLPESNRCLALGTGPAKGEEHSDCPPAVYLLGWQLRFALSELKFRHWRGGSPSREALSHGLGVLIQERPWATLKDDFPLYPCFLCKDTSTRKELQ